MKNTHTYLLIVMAAILLQANLVSANDEFGTYVAKAVFFKWSPKASDIKEINADYYDDQYQDQDDEADRTDYTEED